MPRHIFMGDIHGCYAEVCDLLAKVAVRDGDRVISLGDMVRKGPDAARVIDLWLERGYEAVLGNIDAKLIARARRPLWRLFSPTADRAVMNDRRRLDFLRALPVYRDYPSLGVVAVHGGVLPNSKAFDATLVPRDTALELRYVRRDDSSGQWTFVPKGEQRASDPFWADLWKGDRLVVYGHTPRDEPKVHSRAIGLDTGCVYGGRLTAAVFEDRDRWTLVSVPARRRYAS
ncbi:MAG TPA: metallophosphoesterase [Thermoanaerobaculia bacterium]|nr:metallophosphoesterase [Thermoanaerobaculia bacterium]